MVQVTIAAIEGFCIGGGVVLAVALDFRIMASNAHIRVPEIGYELAERSAFSSRPRSLRGNRSRSKGHPEVAYSCASEVAYSCASNEPS